jgi:hypothetical protein
VEILELSEKRLGIHSLIPSFLVSNFTELRHVTFQISSLLIYLVQRNIKM